MSWNSASKTSSEKKKSATPCRPKTKKAPLTLRAAPRAQTVGFPGTDPYRRKTDNTKRNKPKQNYHKSAGDATPRYETPVSENANAIETTP
mmetsp:Transcript_103124/g.210297  ORF Transcript_103124/g.210297 Transcript_103124/m.210297 type:complete len:91 (-) Transcript_103124:189-461(-)